MYFVEMIGKELQTITCTLGIFLIYVFLAIFSLYCFSFLVVHTMYALRKTSLYNKNLSAKSIYHKIPRAHLHEREEKIMEGRQRKGSIIFILYYGSRTTIYMLVPQGTIDDYKNKCTGDFWYGVNQYYIWENIPHEHSLNYQVEEQKIKVWCTQDGNIAYFRCKNQACGQIFMDEDCTIPATNIVDPMKVHEMSEATCTEASKCTRANCTHIVGTKLGHTYGNVTFKWEADYSKATASCICINDASHVLTSECVVVSKVVKEATATEKGQKVYTATATLNGNTYTEEKSMEIPMLQSDTPDGNDNDEDGEDDEDDDEDDDDEDDDEDDEDEYMDYDDVDLDKDDVAKDAKSITLNEKLKVIQTGSQFNIYWGKLKQADGYDIYVQRCGKKFKSKPTKIVKGNKKTSIKVKKLDGKKIKLTKSYKVRVVAYKYVDGEKVVLAKSLTAHFRYVSSDKSVATVSKNGKIKAVEKGTCNVYVYDKNGCAKKIKVTVK